MTRSEAARERVIEHLQARGYSRKDGPKHTYMTHQDGVQRYKLTSRTVQRQRHEKSLGWFGISRARSLIEVARLLGNA